MESYGEYIFLQFKKKWYLPSKQVQIPIPFIYLVETYMRLIMKNIFENTKSIWVKYSDYEIKKADNGVDYITPTSNATPIMRHIFGTCFRARETDFLLCNYLQFQFIIVATLLWFWIYLLLLLLLVSS